MKTRIGAIALAAAIASISAQPVSSQANELSTAGSLREQCGFALSPDTQASQAGLLCLSYIMGVSDMQIAIRGRGEQPFYCAPPGVSYVQLAAVYKKWADEHPEHWHEFKLDALLRSLKAAYPCG